MFKRWNLPSLSTSSIIQANKNSGNGSSGSGNNGNDSIGNIGTNAVTGGGMSLHNDRQLPQPPPVAVFEPPIPPEEFRLASLDRRRRASEALLKGLSNTQSNSSLDGNEKLRNAGQPPASASINIPSSASVVGHSIAAPRSSPSQRSASDGLSSSLDNEIRGPEHSVSSFTLGSSISSNGRGRTPQKPPTSRRRVSVGSRSVPQTRYSPLSKSLPGSPLPHEASDGEDDEAVTNRSHSATLARPTSPLQFDASDEMHAQKFEEIRTMWENRSTSQNPQLLPLEPQLSTLIAPRHSSRHQAVDDKVVSAVLSKLGSTEQTPPKTWTDIPSPPMDTPTPIAAALSFDETLRNLTAENNATGKEQLPKSESIQVPATSKAEIKEVKPAIDSKKPFIALSQGSSIDPHGQAPLSPQEDNNSKTLLHASLMKPMSTISVPERKGSLVIGSLPLSKPKKKDLETAIKAAFAKIQTLTGEIDSGAQSPQSPTRKTAVAVGKQPPSVSLASPTVELAKPTPLTSPRDLVPPLTFAKRLSLKSENSQLPSPTVDSLPETRASLTEPSERPSEDQAFSTYAVANFPHIPIRKASLAYVVGPDNTVRVLLQRRHTVTTTSSSSSPRASVKDAGALTKAIQGEWTGGESVSTTGAIANGATSESDIAPEIVVSGAAHSDMDAPPSVISDHINVADIVRPSARLSRASGESRRWSFSSNPTVLDIHPMASYRAQERELAAVAAAAAAAAAAARNPSQHESTISVAPSYPILTTTLPRTHVASFSPVAPNIYPTLLTPVFLPPPTIRTSSLPQAQGISPAPPRERPSPRPNKEQGPSMVIPSVATLPRNVPNGMMSAYHTVNPRLILEMQRLQEEQEALAKMQDWLIEAKQRQMLRQAAEEMQRR